MLRSLTVAVLITVGGGLLAIAHAQTDVSGSWTITMVTDQGNNDVPMTIEQDGDMLKGTWGTEPLEGTISGNEITIASEVPDSPVGPLPLTFTGMVDGSDMKGSVDFGGLASGTWTAVKN